MTANPLPPRPRVYELLEYDADTDTVTMFHGTCLKSYVKIKVEGLQPSHAGEGIDGWIQKFTAPPAGRREARVYVSCVRYMADIFAGHMAHLAHDKASTLEFRIPKENFDLDFEPDVSDAFRTRKPIPPEWIVGTYWKGLNRANPDGIAQETKLLEELRRNRGNPA